MKKIIARIVGEVVEVLQADEIIKLDLKPAWKNWDVLRDAGYDSTALAGVPTVEGYLTFSKPETDADKFEMLCAQYDWFYQMSDDGGVYNAGVRHDRKMDELHWWLGATVTAPIWVKYIKAKVGNYADASHFMASYAYRFGATKSHYLGKGSLMEE